MPSVRAASSALPRSREAIAVTSLHTPFCMPGMTFVTAMFAVLKIPQRTLDIARHHSCKRPWRKNVRGPEVGFRDAGKASSSFLLKANRGIPAQDKVVYAAP